MTSTHIDTKRIPLSLARARRRLNRRVRLSLILPELLEQRCLLSASYTTVTVATFNGTNGLEPNGPMVFESGNLFGVTDQGGGDGGIGTVFEIPASGVNAGTITTLVNLGDQGINAATPVGGLINSGGNLFGVDQGGGNGSGSVFELAGGTAFSTIGTFSGNGIENDVNASGPLTDVNGNIFGVAVDGGANNAGEVFEIAGGSGTITDLVPFPSPSQAAAGLVADSGGNLYGILDSDGGSNGTIFKVTGSSLSTLASFTSINTPFTTGSQESAPIIESNGNLFGVDHAGVFEVSDNGGSITQLGNASGLSGQCTSQLIMDGSGDLFGATTNGVFEWVASTKSFNMIATLPTSVSGFPNGVTFGDNGDIFVTDGGAGGNGAIFELEPNGGGGGGGGGGSSGALTPSISGKLPSSTIAGQKASISETLTITASSAAYDATSTSKLFLSTGTTIDGNSIEIGSPITKTLKLKSGAHTTLKFALKSLPSSVPNGTYHVVAQVTDSSGNANTAASSGTITVAPPTVNLKANISKFAGTAKGGKKFTETLSIANSGNVPATGTVPIEVFTSPDGLQSDETMLTTIAKKLNIKNGKSQSVPLNLTAPASGTADFLIFEVDPGNTLKETTPANDIVVSASKVTFT